MIIMRITTGVRLDGDDNEGTRVTWAVAGGDKKRQGDEGDVMCRVTAFFPSESESHSRAGAQSGVWAGGQVHHISPL